jgi:2-amino-4-hydroxy-6-hydroxymethyldihydropteridine diphosphokinase
MALCAISLGGNVGDVPKTFADARRLLESSGRVAGLKQSRLYRSRPMGCEAGGEFHNAAAVFETTLTPPNVLELLQDVERRCGRVRTVRWGPRTLDLDLLLYGDEVIDSPRLIVPHPALWHRRFVLDPLTELIPDVVHPAFQQTIRELRERLRSRPLPVGWAASPSFLSLIEGLQTAYPQVNWITTDETTSAAIVFAGPGIGIPLPQMIDLPKDEMESRQFIMDVLTAALDEPVVVTG